MGASTSIPKGTRDFGPVEMTRRNYIFDIIRDVFKRYGYLPVETPAIENLSTLLGKYGDEGDKLLFRILNSGDFLSKIDSSELSEVTSEKLSPIISKKGLKYDLTVPFARFIVQHRNDITFPFKRYQIQPVWRADRPQKGRYREFYQCDADVIGSDSLYNEFELVQVIDEVFSKLKIRNVIKINNRKLLAGIAEIVGEKERIVDITVAIDKIEKIGIEGVNREMEQKGVSVKAIGKLQPFLFLEGSTEEKLSQLSVILIDSETGLKGVKEAETLFGYINSFEMQSQVELDLTLARGLNYYTGAIIEVKALDYEIGSICGGGRYDDLAGSFGMAGVSGVGVSFGADRIYDVLDKLNIFPERAENETKILFVNFGGDEEMYAIRILGELRRAGISAELYPDPVKIKKQMTFANSRNIPYVAIAGEDEISRDKISVKNMDTGTQSIVSSSELINILNNK